MDLDFSNVNFQQRMVDAGWVKVPGGDINLVSLKESNLRLKVVWVALRRACYIVGDAIGEYLGLEPRVK